MSYTFVNANSCFFGDAGAGNEKTSPCFIVAHVKIATGQFATSRQAACISNSTDTSTEVPGYYTYMRGTVAPDGRAGGAAFSVSEGTHVSTPTFAATAASFEGVWTGLGFKIASQSSRTGY